MMSDVRLINANALKEKLQADHDFYINAWGGFKNLPANDKARVDELTASIAAVVNAPTIDAVPVVRCRECKYLIAPKVCANPMACGWDALEPDDDDFCSRGEKKDGGAE